MTLLSVSPRWFFGILAFVVVALAAWLAWDLRAARQLDKVFVRFVEAGERRDWKAVGAHLAQDYRDGWGFHREEALSAASEVFGQFFALEITTEPRTRTIQGTTAVIRTRPKLAGNGTAVAQWVRDRANELREDTVFTWRRESWKPWDWKLVAVEQPEVSGL